MKRWVDIKDRWAMGQPVVCLSRVWQRSPGYDSLALSVPAGTRGLVSCTWDHMFPVDDDTSVVIAKIAIVQFTTDDGYTFETNINTNALRRLPRR